MAALKSVVLSEDPTWHSSRTIEAEPGAIELALEGPIIHVRVIGKSTNATRFLNRIGAHFALREWRHVVFADDMPQPKK